MPTSTVPSPVEGLVVHVDGDYCAYFCAGNDDVDPGTARRILLNKIEKLQRVSGATQALVHLTDSASKKGQRYLAATLKPYQGQRKGSRKPKNWGMLREFMDCYDGNKFRVKNWLTREADDGMAYLAHWAAHHGTNSVIATCDKDMRMLPGTHVIWKTNQLVEVPFGAWEVVGPDDCVYGHKWFWLQCLQGDTADFIPGLPYYTRNGKNILMGPATATKMLAKAESNTDAFEVCAELYESYYGVDWANRLAEQMCLLWLRTDKDAHLLNFMQVVPHNTEMFRAAVALEDRVNAAQRELDTMTCGD